MVVQAIRKKAMIFAPDLDAAAPSSWKAREWEDKISHSTECGPADILHCFLSILSLGCHNSGPQKGETEISVRLKD